MKTATDELAKKLRKSVRQFRHDAANRLEFLEASHAELVRALREIREIGRTRPVSSIEVRAEMAYQADLALNALRERLFRMEKERTPKEPKP